MAGALSRIKRFDNGGPVYDDNYDFGNSAQNADDSNDDAEGALAAAGKNLIGNPEDVAGAFSRAQATRDAATQRQLQLLRTARSRIPPASGGGLNPQLAAAAALLSTPGNFGQGLGGAFAAYGNAQDREEQDALRRARELGQYDLAEGDIGTKGADADYNILKERFGLGERAANAAAIIKQRQQAALDRAAATRDASAQRAAATRETNARIAADAAARADILRDAAADRDARARDATDQRREAADKATYQPGPGPDPKDPSKQIQGMWELPARRGEPPVFHAEGTFSRGAGATTRISALAQLTKDHQNGLISDEDFDAGRKKLTHFADTDRLIATTGADGKTVWTKSSNAEGKEVGTRGTGARAPALQQNIEYMIQKGLFQDSPEGRQAAMQVIRQSGNSTISYQNLIERVRDRLAKTGKGDADTFIPYTPQELDQLAREEARQVQDEAKRQTAPAPRFNAPFAGRDTREIAGASGVAPAPAPAATIKPLAPPSIVPAAIPPRPAGVPAGAKYSPSQKKWWWQQDGQWKSSATGG